MRDQAGYVELIRNNANFRRLWAGQLVSLLGDWFNTIALYSLIASLTGSPLAMGGVFLFKMVPWALASPVAGLLVDRFNRRQIMIVADLLRAVAVLGFLLVDRAEHVPLAYLLIALQVIIGSVFDPAKSASLPNITSPRELITANALSSASWSVMLAIGAGVGGLATEWLGIRAVFLIDSATYLVSAYFIYRTRIPQQTGPAGRGSPLGAAYRQFTDGWGYLLSRPQIGRIALAKTAWAVGGGATVYMLTLLGQQLFPGTQAAGMGALFFARGIGTGIGPVLARNLFVDQKRWPAVLGVCISLSGLSYLTIGFHAWPIGAMLAVGCAHAASGANWVFSTVLLQQRTIDAYRGRVFASEMLLVLGTESLSILAASLMLEYGGFSLQTAFLVFASLQVLSGLAWLQAVVPAERRGDAASHA
ncbi:MAG: MFS transporter [Rhodothermales bacterium]|nr:MFS transporter [Rhodothermales bacterium]